MAPEPGQDGDQENCDPTHDNAQHCHDELGAVAIQKRQQQHTRDGDEDSEREGRPAYLRAHAATCSRATTWPVVIWQATTWPASYSVSAGSIVSHSPALNSGQRGWKVQAGGRFSRLGIFWFCR